MTEQEDLTGEGSEVPGQEPPERASSEAPTGEESEPLQPLDVYSLLRVALSQFQSVAWQKLGLQPDLFTGKIEKDVTQARLAIDTVAALLALLKSQLQEPELKHYQAALTDLRLNFVSHSGEQPASG